jgi:hypothetical protein
MKYEIKDFIARFENAFDKEFCQTAIRYYETMNKAGFGRDRQATDAVPTTMKEGSQIYFTQSLGGFSVPTNLHMKVLKDIWETYYRIYRDKYAVLHTPDPQSIQEMKIQKTEPGQGYHVWHFETGSKPCSNKLFNYQLFLNTVEEGGETEFLYLSRREPAVEGTLLIYPAGFTHTHRGNPPLSGTKYILNGWIEY